ncbi:MAG: hypothetical protein HKP49_07515 [Maribacter sp.]|nr:hypothetical protein [Maribacter sp.]
MNKKATKHYKRWKYQAPIGLTVVGTGICLVIDAGFQKYNGVHWWVWVGYGTFALVVLNAGLSLFVDAALHRIRYELADQEKL